MAEDQKTTGLSRDFIIHPGETIAEILEDREMTQKELAIRTGMTDKHVSTIVNGAKPISVAFAKKLEYALGIEAQFWINLQANYDREIFEFEEMNSISVNEISVLKNLKEVICHWCELGWIKNEEDQAFRVLEIRKIMAISNLVDIPELAYSASFRAQIKNNSVDVFVLFAWQRMCEILTKDIFVSEELDIEKLKEKIPEIKSLMFLNPKEMQKQLEKKLAECGIAFKIVKHFKGAPVQGFIKRTDNGRLVLCMPIRNSFADIFWFTLFHEIAHVIHGDAKVKFFDFESISTEIEVRADKFARNSLIRLAEYKKFLEKEDYSLKAVKDFSKKCEVETFIVFGRLMKDEVLDWGTYSEERVKYKWA